MTATVDIIVVKIGIEGMSKERSDKYVKSIKNEFDSLIPERVIFLSVLGQTHVDVTKYRLKL